MENENVFLLYAVIMGVWVTFIYDILRIFRRVAPHSQFWVSLEDFGFWVFCAVEVFVMMHRESNGTLRWFAVLGALAGMIVYRKTLSVLLVKYVTLVLQKVIKILGKVLGILLKPFAAAGRAAGKAAGAVERKRKSGVSFLKKKLTMFLKMLKMVISRK